MPEPSPPEANGEAEVYTLAERQTPDAFQLLINEYSHDPEALAANVVGVLGRAASLAPLTYRTGLDRDQILGEPAQALALRLLQATENAEQEADAAVREGFQSVMTLLQREVGPRYMANALPSERQAHFRTHLHTLVALKSKPVESLRLAERRQLVLFDVRLRHAAGRHFRGYCEAFDGPPPATYVHPDLYEQYFIDAGIDAIDEIAEKA